MEPKKVAFVKRAVAASTRLAQVLAELTDLREVWEDRAYKTGAAAEIKPEDIFPSDLPQSLDIVSINRFLAAAKDLADWRVTKTGLAKSINELREDT